MSERRRNSSRAERKSNKRFDNVVSWLYFLFILFAVALIIHLFFIQVIDIKKYKVKARKQRASQNFAVRGDIYDRNGIKLATDTVYFDIFARKEDFVHSPEELAKILAPILKISQVDLTEKLRQDVSLIEYISAHKRLADLVDQQLSLDRVNVH